VGAGQADRDEALNPRSDSGPEAAGGIGWLTTLLVAQLAFGLLAMTISVPSMQDWPAIFGASQASVQLTFSGYVAAYGGLQLLFGPWSDRVGRKPLMLAGLALACAGCVLAAFAPGLGVLTLARVVQGAGAAAGMVIGRAMVQDLFTGSERTRMMAFIGMTMGVCPPVATLVGGQLHVALGWRSNFVLMAVLAALLLAAAWRGLPARRPDPAARSRGLRELLQGYGLLLREPAFLLYVTIVASTTAVFYAFLGGAPIVLKAYGVTPDRVGWYILWIPLAYICGNLWTSRLVRRSGEQRIMWMGQGFIFAGLALVLGLGLADARTPLALALPLALVGVGHGLLTPPTLAGTVGVVAALAGSAAAIAGVLQQMTGALAGYLVGVVPHPGQLNLGLLMLVFSAAGLLAQVMLRLAPRPRGG